MRLVITGGTGFVGQPLIETLAPRATGGIVVLSRTPGRVNAQLAPRVAATAAGPVTGRRWDPHKEPLAPDALAGARAVFNLAGEPVVEGRWNDAKKVRIRESRVAGTELLVRALAALPAGERPEVLVQASAVGYYGDRGDALLDESADPGADFLARVCVDWERAALPAEALGVRVVRLRIGVVLHPDGGALGKMLPAFRAGVGGRVGSGRQWMPWIAREDVVNALVACLDDSRLTGAVNAVAPEPCTNAEFTRALAAVLHRPAFLPVPELALRLAFGEVAAVILGSQRVVPRALESAAFTFRHRTLDAALHALLA